MTPTNEPSRFIPLAPHSFQILLSLLERELHGYSIIKDIEARTGGEMVLGTSTLYAAVKRMVQKGLLEEAMGPASDSSGGPKRKYYRIMDLGREVARAEGIRITRLQQMVAGSALLDGAPAPLAEESKS